MASHRRRLFVKKIYDKGIIYTLCKELQHFNNRKDKPIKKNTSKTYEEVNFWGRYTNGQQNDEKHIVSNIMRNCKLQLHPNEMPLDIN